MWYPLRFILLLFLLLQRMFFVAGCIITSAAFPKRSTGVSRSWKSVRAGTTINMRYHRIVTTTDDDTVMISSRTVLSTVVAGLPRPKLAIRIAILIWSRDPVAGSDATSFRVEVSRCAPAISDSATCPRPPQTYPHHLLDIVLRLNRWARCALLGWVIIAGTSRGKDEVAQRGKGCEAR